METQSINNKELFNNQLEQISQRTNELNTILSSNVFAHHLSYWVSLLVGSLLYLLFLVALILIANLFGEDYQTFGFIALPSPFIALLLRLNRKRNALIHSASGLVQKIKLDLNEHINTVKK